MDFCNFDLSFEYVRILSVIQQNNQLYKLIGIIVIYIVLILILIKIQLDSIYFLNVFFFFL